MNTQYYIEPQEENFEPVANIVLATETLYLTPAEFATHWVVLAWMRDKWNLARREETLLEVEVEHTRFGRHVTALNVVNNK